MDNLTNLTATTVLFHVDRRHAHGQMQVELTSACIHHHLVPSGVSLKPPSMPQSRYDKWNISPSAQHCPSSKPCSTAARVTSSVMRHRKHAAGMHSDLQENLF